MCKRAGLKQIKNSEIDLFILFDYTNQWKVDHRCCKADVPEINPEHGEQLYLALKIKFEDILIR